MAIQTGTLLRRGYDVVNIHADKMLHVLRAAASSQRVDFGRCQLEVLFHMRKCPPVTRGIIGGEWRLSELELGRSCGCGVLPKQHNVTKTSSNV